MKIEFIGIKTPLITSTDKNLTNMIINALKSNNVKLQDRDIIIIASKIVSIIEGGQILFNDINSISDEAVKLASITQLDPHFIEIVLREADEIIGAVTGAILALKDNIIQANAGVDQSNAGGENKLVILPKNPIKTANNIRKQIKIQTNKNVGIIIADSKIHPLRRGTSGFALAVAGFKPIIDDRGTPDLYGRPMVVTTRAIADNLVCGAEILMGETNQKIPIVIARNCFDIEFHDLSEEEEIENNREVKIDPEHCFYMGPLWYNKNVRR